MQKRNVLNSPRLLELKKSRRRVLLNKIGILFLGLVVIFFFLAYISRLPALNITGVQISGNKVIDTDKIKSVVNDDINGKYLWLFPKTNILLYPKHEVAEDLHQEFGRLKDINVSIVSKTLNVSVSEREPKYTWCGIVPPEVTGTEEKCYFMDVDGYIFDEAPYFSGEVYFKFYGATNLVSNVPSGFYFNQKLFPRLATLKTSIESIGLKPASIYVEDNGDIKVSLSSKATNAPYIALKEDGDFGNAVLNLEAALNTEPLQSDFKNKYDSLKYIDLRFGNKVYYKFE